MDMMVGMALQDVAAPVAAGPPAMFVSLNEVCEGWARLVLELHLPMSLVLLL